MSIKNTFGKLGAIALLGTIGFMPIEKAYSQNAPSSFFILNEYNIKVGQEKVTFIERVVPGPTGPKGFEYTITVKKPNGTIIEYKDFSGSDLKIERIEITRNGKTEYYDARAVKSHDLIIEEGQKRFDSYLKEIDKIRLKESKDIFK